MKRPGARRLRPWAVGLPMLLIVGLIVLRNVILTPLLGTTRAKDVSDVMAVFGVLVFSLIIWRMVERAETDLASAYRLARLHERQLVALHEAALSITAALDLPTVLRRVVERSRAVIGSRYGAVAVLTPDGAIDEFVTSGIDEETIRRLGATPTGHGLLGLVISHRRPLLVEEIAAHPHSVGFPPGHPPMKTLLAVPLLFQNTVLGSLYLADREGGRPFDAEDQETLERFGAQAAIAVANARLYGELQRLSLVEERERISMDLHDGVLQTLYATGLGLEAALEDVDADPPAAKAGVERAIDRLHGTISDIRHYIFDLRAAQQEGGCSLPVMLQQLLDGFQHPGVELCLDAVDAAVAEPDVSKRVQWECWHVAREAVANALRHSGCRRVAVTLRLVGRDLQLRVADDGVGFDTSTPAGQGHRGLRNMQRRAESVRGRLRVESAPGRGAAVTFSVPLPAEGGASG